MPFWVTTAMDGADPFANPVIGEMKTKQAASLFVEGRVKALSEEGFKEMDRSEGHVVIFNPGTGRVIAYGIVETKARPKPKAPEDDDAS